MENIHKFVGKRIREERLKRELTQQEVADLSGITNNFLSYIESGKKQASLDTIHKIADALHISLSELFLEIAIRKNDYSLNEQILPLLKDKPKKDREFILDLVRLVSKKMKKK
ncbi:MAG: helix-turn-helix transcriptional regulator [Elusimicrobia bacterium]|nr:helix-turn-helix transcriptional regulator [Elusimicrobiota bacterium]